MLAINLYNSNFLRGLMGRSCEVSLGAASAASAPSTAATSVCARLGLMQPFARLASCLLGTIVELFECLQHPSGVVFLAWSRLVFLPSLSALVSCSLCRFLKPSLPSQVVAFRTRQLQP
jgi:hypothetical protein